MTVAFRETTDPHAFDMARYVRFHRQWRAARPALLVLLLPLLMPALVSAQDQKPPDRSSEPVFVPTDLIFVGGVAIGTLGISPLDKQFARYLSGDPQTRRSLRRLSWTVENITQPGAWIIGGGLYLAGRAFDSDRMATLGLRGTEAMVIGLLVTTGIKMAAGRARPYVDFELEPREFKFLRGVTNEDYRSFPSGHTVMAFAVAVVVTEQTRRWWDDAQWYVGPLMYGGATLVGISRMYDNKHWASDVLMGAAIGTFTGAKVMRYHTTRPDNKIDEWFLGASVVPKAGGGYALRPLIYPILRR